MVYVSHDKTLRNQGSWSLAGIWNHSWSATACDMRDCSNVFACLQDLFLTGAADELLLQPSLRAWDQPATSPECQMMEEGGFAHTHRTCDILVNEQQGPPLQQRELLSAVIYWHHGTRNRKSVSFPVFFCSDTWTAHCPLGWEPPWIARQNATAGTGNLLHLWSRLCAPKSCSDLTDSNRGGGLAPAQIVSLMGEGTGAAESSWLGQWESRLWSEVGGRDPAPACRTLTPLPLTSSRPSSQRGAEIVLVSERQLSQTVESRLA